MGEPFRKDPSLTPLPRYGGDVSSPLIVSLDQHSPLKKAHKYPK
jgi:hypothetical protein